VGCTIKLEEVHLRALRTLLDRLESENIAPHAHSDQEGYDMVFALECLRLALKDATTAPVMHQRVQQPHNRAQPRAKRGGD
jgi:hypothetical protein